MSTNSTMINDRYCWNCGAAKRNCNSGRKSDFYGYCVYWTPEYPGIKEVDIECPSCETSGETEL